MRTVAGPDVDHLTRMYRVMKSDLAAWISDRMDPGFVAGFLRLMRSDQAGLILANKDAKKARMVSSRLASMNDDVCQMGRAPNRSPLNGPAEYRCLSRSAAVRHIGRETERKC